jgi:hypothetical protein
MDEGLCIGNLPDWRYAGKRAEGVIPNARLKDGNQEIVVFMHPSPKHDPKKPNKHIKREYIASNGYLIPRYPVEERSYRRREQELLIDRVLRFFYSCEPGLDIERTGRQIANEIALFDTTLREINASLHKQDQPDFNFSTSYREMSAEERMLMAQGAQVVGHAVNRLGRLGRLILQGNRDGVKIEYDDQYVTEHMKDIQKEFSDLWIKLAFTDKDIVRCVLTRDGKPDHDGIFADLIREIGKPLQAVISDQQLPDSATPEVEQHARNNIITKIGYTLEAIDEVATAMAKISQHPNFNRLLKRTCEEQARANPHRGVEDDLSVSNYRGLLKEYIEICRARACLKTDDADNFTPVAARLRFLQTELGLHHETLFKNTQYPLMGRSSHDPKSEQAISLLKRGVGMMGEMAELRMPRNQQALDVYDRYSEEYKDRDASSVGRYHEEIERVVESFKGMGLAI